MIVCIAYKHAPTLYKIIYEEDNIFAIELTLGSIIEIDWK